MKGWWLQKRFSVFDQIALGAVRADLLVAVYRNYDGDTIGGREQGDDGFTL